MSQKPPFHTTSLGDLNNFLSNCRWVFSVLWPRKCDLVGLHCFKGAVLTVVTVLLDLADVLTALAVFGIEYAGTNSISYTFTKTEMKKNI